MNLNIYDCFYKKKKNVFKPLIQQQYSDKLCNIQYNIGHNLQCFSHKLISAIESKKWQIYMYLRSSYINIYILYFAF